jgi:hypothetical protein
MDDLTTWALLVGTLAPLVIAAVQRPGWPTALRTGVSVLFCLIAGLGTAYLEGSLTTAEVTGGSLLRSTLAVLVAAQATYRGVWQPSGIAGTLERVTSPGGGTSVSGADPSSPSVS